MKDVKFIFCVLIASLLVSIGLVSCSHDDDEPTSEAVTEFDSEGNVVYNFVYSEAEQYIRNLTAEESCPVLQLSKEDSIFFDDAAKDILSKMLPVSLSKKSTTEQQAEDIVSGGNHVVNDFTDSYSIEYTHWDAGKWGIASWGNFETYVGTTLKGNDKYLLVIFYKEAGFRLSGNAYIKLATVTNGKVLMNREFHASDKYVVLPYKLNTNLPEYGFVNICPLVISSDGQRSYDNCIYIKSEPHMTPNCWTFENHEKYGTVNGVDLINSGKGNISNYSASQCVAFCGKFINTMFDVDRKVWGDAKDWPSKRKTDAEGYTVYPNDGSMQVREGDVVCFDELDGDLGHVATVIKTGIDYISIAHQNAGYSDVNMPIGTRLEVKNKVIYDRTPGKTTSPIYKTPHRISYFIRKSSDKDGDYTPSITDDGEYVVYSVKQGVIDNIQHKKQGSWGCNYYSYVMAASTLAHYLDGDKTQYNVTSTKITSVGNDVNSDYMYKMVEYAKGHDYTFIKAKYITDNNAAVKDEAEFETFIQNALKDNCIVIVNMRGNYDNASDSKLYSDDPSVNPDLGNSPIYMNGDKSEIGHIFPIVSIKVNPKTGDGIVGYFDSCAEHKEGKNNVKYVSYSNLKKAVLSASLAGGYNAYYVGLVNDPVVTPDPVTPDPVTPDYITYSVNDNVFDNLQHLNQGNTSMCNAYAYTIAASTWAHVLDGNKTEYKATTSKAEAVYSSIGQYMINAVSYCKNNDKSFLTAKYINDGSAEKDVEKFKTFIQNALSDNRIVIVDMKGAMGYASDSRLYSPDASVNPDLGSSPIYFKGVGGGHVLGILSIKVDKNNPNDGIVAYYDSYAQHKTNPRDNIKYVSYANFLNGVKNAESTNNPGAYDAYWIGLINNPVVQPEPEPEPKITVKVGNVSINMIRVEGNGSIKDFYMAEFETPQELYKAVTGENPSEFSNSKYPVESVSWDEAQNFIKLLNGKNVGSGGTFRLPTKEEWIYAAKGGAKSKGYTYSGSNTLSDVAWYYDNSGKTTHKVGSKNANELGLYDMSGNVSEWCQDDQDKYAGTHVVLGGSWNNSEDNCKSSMNSGYNGGYFNDLGFRIVLSF